MSETVKLIVEISKEDIELIRKTSFVEDERTMFKQSPSDRQGTMMLFRLMDSIKDGISLEEVKTEIKKEENIWYHDCEPENGWKRFDVIRVDTVFDILDNIGKESEK